MIAVRVLEVWWPPAWGRAARIPWAAVLVSVAVWHLVVPGALAVARVAGLYRNTWEWAITYDDHAPRVVVSGGRVSVADDRVLREEVDGVTWLLDTRETIALEEIPTAEAWVVREREIVHRDRLRTEITPVANLQGLVGGGELTFDTATLSRFLDRWALPLAAVAVVAMVVVLAPLFGLSSLAQALVGATLLRPVARMAGRPMTLDQAARVALTTAVPGLAACHLVLGLDGGLCAGLVVGFVVTLACAAAGILVDRPPPGHAPNV